MTLTSCDLDMRNHHLAIILCVIGNLLIIDLARVELLSSPKVVGKERNRVESLDDVRSCELDGPKAAREQPPGREEGEEQG